MSVKLGEGATQSHKLLFWEDFFTPPMVHDWVSTIWFVTLRCNIRDQKMINTFNKGFV
jgi:hypothetical protein